MDAIYTLLILCALCTGKPGDNPVVYELPANSEQRLTNAQCKKEKEYFVHLWFALVARGGVYVLCSSQVMS